ncbi:hypothetical protein C2C87_24285 [Escherichia coli]|nr:hypothetical protein [Escherichia coli]
MTQHIVSSVAESGTTYCAYRRWRCVGGEEDPELVFGSQETEEDTKRWIIQSQTNQYMKLKLALFAKTDNTNC